MNELKLEDVMRALECCSDCNCPECPYVPKGDCHKGTMGCSEEMLKNALALLREKDAGIAMMAECIERQDKEIAQKDAEIERLKAYNKELDNLCDILHKKLDEGYAEFANEERAEAITEFAERLRAELLEKDFYPVIVKNAIEKIAKEMKGEGNGNCE